jgi:uncharacterized protein (TIGR00297 family)
VIRAPGGRRSREWPARRLLTGFLLSSGIALLARRQKALSRSGVPAAIVTGTTIHGMGGWDLGLTLIFFFVSSSLLSRLRTQEKERTAAEKFRKGAERDLWQVVANGGVATVCALGYGLGQQRPAREVDGPASDIWLAAFAGALATANADTWATEVGVLNPHDPRLIIGGRRVPRGTSGAISPLGTLTAAAGALATGAVLQLLHALARRSQKASPQPQTASLARSFPLLLLGALAGLAGSLLDSLLGATLQAVYYCPRCGVETEQRLHRCGTATRLRRGLRRMNNDVVNFLATLGGSLLAAAAASLVRRLQGHQASRSASELKNGSR